jgi:GT2 family glycosyltransferase/SAM-dependent methyltransferase
VSLYDPLEVLHVDLEDGLSSLTKQVPSGDRDFYVVFWRAGIPLGHLELTREQIERPAALANLVARSIAPAVGDRLLPTGFKGAPRDAPRVMQIPDLGALVDMDNPLVRLGERPEEVEASHSQLRMTVVVCTRDRPNELDRCLSSLVATTQIPDEIVVVDNQPSVPATRDVVDKLPQVTYVAEPRGGLSRARNTGLKHSTGDIIAFTDDDTEVHPDWPRRLRAAFDSPDVMVATGLVLPAELETTAQVTFEKGMGGFSQGYQRILYDEVFVKHTSRGGIPVWRIGAGANMAIRREAFALVGQFDERLGAGAAGCSEDSEFWYRILAAGFHCRYEPAAVVFHYHRREFAPLRRLARDYLRGHVAALFVQYSRFGHRGNLRRAFFGLPRSLFIRALREYLSPGLRTTIVPASVSGYLRGLILLPLAFRRGKRSARSESPATATARSRGRKARRSEFLRRNPYPHPRSEGLFYREKMRAIHSVAPEGPFERILEVGGGQSGLTADLYPGAAVINIDLEIDYRRSSLNQRPGTQFVVADATRLPFRAESFDAATFFDVLEHIADHEVAAVEARRVVAPDGVFLVTSPNERWRFPYYRILRPLCPSEDDIMAEWGHVRRGYSVDELHDLLKSHPQGAATSVTPVTAVGHDLAFSKLPERVRRLVCAAISPLTWFGYWVHRPEGRGTETATSWRRLVDR